MNIISSKSVSSLVSLSLAAALMVAAPRVAFAAEPTDASSDDRFATTAKAPEADRPAGERPSESPSGMVGSLSFASALSAGSTGSEGEINCGGVRSSCAAEGTKGGGLMVSMGYTWKYLGFDVLGGGTLDGGARSHVDAKGAARSHAMERVGGFAAVRLRGTVQSDDFRITLAAGPGLVHRLVGAASEFPSIPKDTGTYKSFAFTADLSVQWRASRTTALALGAMVWMEDAGRDVTTSEAGQRVHMVSGLQTTMMPYLGFVWGP